MDTSDTVDAKLRRYKSNLRSDGMGYILFGVWGIIRIVVTTLRMDEVRATFDELIVDAIKDGFSDGEVLFVILLTALVILVIMALVLGVHVIIGKGAMNYSAGKKTGCLFWIFLVSVFLLELVGLTSYFTKDSDAAREFDDTVIAAFLIDVTMAYILFDIMYCIGRIKKLKKSAEETGAVKE